jgi:hypothetical protein
MSFSQQSIHDRISGLAGKPAELAFETVMADKDRIIGKNLFRFGFDQVDTSAGVVATFPKVLRHAPDYVSVGGHAYECQGCGVDRIITIKQDKLVDLLKWQEFLNRKIRWAFYVQPDDIVLFATMDAVLWAVNQPEAEVTVLDAGTRGEKSAWKVPVELLLRRRVKDAFEAERKVNGSHS